MHTHSQRASLLAGGLHTRPHTHTHTYTKTHSHTHTRPHSYTHTHTHTTLPRTLPRQVVLASAKWCYTLGKWCSSSGATHTHTHTRHCHDIAKWCCFVLNSVLCVVVTSTLKFCEGQFNVDVKEHPSAFASLTPEDHFLVLISSQLARPSHLLPPRSRFFGHNKHPSVMVCLTAWLRNNSLEQFSEGVIGYGYDTTIRCRCWTWLTTRMSSK